MRHIMKPARLMPKEEGQLRAPTFKNSLRLWQAEWKASRATGGGRAAAPGQSTSGKPGQT